MRSSFNAWQSFQLKQGAKPRNRAGGAKRRNWASQPSFKSVCIVRTSNDETPHLGPWPTLRPKIED